MRHVICSCSVVAAAILIGCGKVETPARNSKAVEVAIDPEPVENRPTTSNIVNHTPIISPVGEPTYSEWTDPFEGGYAEKREDLIEVWSNVEYMTSAEYEVIDNELSRYLDKLGYELNPDRGTFNKGDSEVGFLYDTFEGTHRVSLTEYRVVKKEDGRMPSPK